MRRPRRPRRLLGGPVLPLPALGALHGHAEAARSAAAGGRVAAVRQVREAGGARVFCAVAWWAFGEARYWGCQEGARPGARGEAGTHQRSWTAGWRSWSCGSDQSGTCPRGWTGSVRPPLAPLGGGGDTGLPVALDPAVHTRPLTESGWEVAHSVCPFNRLKS